MSMSKLASQIAKMEGKKVEVSIGNIREVLHCLAVLQAAACARNDLNLPRRGPLPLDVVSAKADKLIIKITKQLKKGMKK